MIYEEKTKIIQESARKLLLDKKADVIIAYRGGGLSGLQVPFIVNHPDEVKDIEWGDRCWQNLAKYLLGIDKKAGIVAKPCDSRAINEYIKENQVKRENVHIISVECSGIVDENGDLRPGCAECGDRISLPGIKEAAEEKESLAGDFAKFRKEIDKCILCFACRQACFGCYCKSCFIEREVPDWQPADIDAGTKMTFHLGRAMHLAGRCVECGSCEASCQSGVNVRYITKEVSDFIYEVYGYKAGMDADEKSALLTHSPDDSEIGFLGGEGIGR